ncbi:MAG: PIG-L family deacetylase [Erysipelotrichaceae bacterium]|nr:PIG-L family deacetylase [Clostridia bacterium]MBQ6217606.1 PIG-L family deacetylase [Erysipelotrichaceae bacterium]
MKILVVGAHLDDIELACGGTIAKAIRNGHEVKALIMSKSGYTNKEGKIQRSDEIAVKEGVDALKTLGIKDIEILEFPTKDIPFRSDVVNAIDVVMSEYDPDIIFTHHPFDTHQAHEGVAKATIAAARRKNTVFFFEPIQPSGRSYVAFKPDMYVGIDDTVDVKIAALKKHKSEYKKFGGEDWIKGVKSRCGFRGYEIGKQYAEAFEILRLELNFEKDSKL